MKQFPRLLMFLAVISLLCLFLFPMWRITLLAPQYPQGVTMYIHINKIAGDSPGTLQNVNILNHYVGMKFIEPESIPELKYFPYIILGLSFLGLIAAAINKSGFYFAWCVLLVALSVAGIYDFYLWEYDYGHDLAANAPIKIPGASFQPPVFGVKQIINFTAISYPALGGIFAGLAIPFAFMAGWIKQKST
ncbi:MAG: hypothetical protein KDC34_14400 [Saprospiraceae bacterium]|nr:hypothetical protein [Saprospiraceae bacterium]